MRKASRALAELNQQQKAVALGGSSKARYREAQVGASNECARRLENSKLSELQDQIATLQEQLEIDQQVHEVTSHHPPHHPTLVCCAETEYMWGHTCHKPVWIWYTHHNLDHMSVYMICCTTMN